MTRSSVRKRVSFGFRFHGQSHGNKQWARGQRQEVGGSHLESQAGSRELKTGSRQDTPLKSPHRVPPTGDHMFKGPKRGALLIQAIIQCKVSDLTASHNTWEMGSSLHPHPCRLSSSSGSYVAQPRLIMYPGMSLNV